MSGERLLGRPQCTGAYRSFTPHPPFMQAIKEALDKRYGGPWHVVMGKAFAFEVTHEVRTRDARGESCMRHSKTPTECLLPSSPASQCVQSKHFMHLFVGGTIGVLVWKL